MTRSEMIDAFVKGEMSRKDFIRGLVASGIALSGAAAHAAALQPGVAVAQDEDDYYTLTSKEQCMNGGYKIFGFKNQGQCIRYVNTGKTPKDGGPPDTDEPIEPDKTQPTDGKPGSKRSTP